MDHIDHIYSVSQVNLYKQCPKKYYYNYILKRIPVEKADSLQFGTAWDDISALAWPINIESLIGQETNKVASDYLKRNMDKLSQVDIIVLLTLFKHYKPEINYSSLYHQASKIVYINNRKFIVKCDTLIRLKNGETVIREAKHTKLDIQGGSLYWRNLELDAQIGIYCYGFEVNTVLYDVVKRPTIRPSSVDTRAAFVRFHADNEFHSLTKKKQSEVIKDGLHLVTPEQQRDCYQTRLEADILENRDKYYQMRNVYKTEKKTTVDLENISHWLYLMMLSIQENMWPMNEKSCANFSGCEYFDVCLGNKDIRDECLFVDKKSLLPKRPLPF